ncbi:MAG TPA: transglycosylase SLT domain-containing protein [Thermoanaerobaculia bacterium]|nr:transglycosylase SLT domain-containing protein [Thermoanaerobaculia bacterium]
MIKKGLTALLLSCAFSACVTSQPASGPRTSPAAQPPRDTLGAEGEIEELRAALEDAYGRIVARTSSTFRPVVVDADAFLSIEVPDHRTIRGALGYFSTNLRPKIQASLLRSSRYKEMVDRILDEHELPRALAYLPVIESAYVPTLTSRAGAHGLWQFMPDTAREYGLRVDWWVDERADPEKSTRAAARYLRDLHRWFGDWSLALAAYNCGPGRVRRALASTGASSFWQLLEQSALPRETRGYVPTFFATLHIASDPPAWGFELKESATLDDATVPVVGPLSIAFIAEATGIDPEDLKGRNPQYRKGILPPGVAEIRVPGHVAPQLAGMRSTLYLEDPHLEIATFTLRPGDSLEKLARSLGVSGDEILLMNARSRVRAGDAIYLPVRQRELASLLSRPTEPASRFYVVQRGDTLYGIAKRHGLTVDELREMNQIDRQATIHPGERLRVSLGAAVTAGGM